MKIPQALIPAMFAVVVTIIGIIVSQIAGWFGADNRGAWFFFTIFTFFGTMISFVWLRQLYWLITRTGDYKKKVNEDTNKEE